MAVAGGEEGKEEKERSKKEEGRRAVGYYWIIDKGAEVRSGPQKTKNTSPNFLE
jgi:hypothetical protein